jgi:hypothetical protein
VIDEIANRPIPFQLNMSSTNRDPVNAPPTAKAKYWPIGIRAIRSPCLFIALLRVRPFARAVRR